MSEKNEVGELKRLLKEKYHFSCEPLLEPNYADINDLRVRNALKNKKPDLFYWNEKDNFLFLVEAKEEVVNHKRAIKDIKERLLLFVSFPSPYKIVGVAFSGTIKNKEHEITTFIIKK